MDKKILIVDDDVSLSNDLKEIFEKSKYLVIASYDGKNGLIDALKEKPDLIILDITMPIMDGISMLKQLRQDIWGKNVPVIMLTNVSSIRMIRYASELYVMDYLIKSKTSFNDVLKIVDNYFEHKE